MTIKRGDDELDRVLRQQFPGAAGGTPKPPKKRVTPPGGLKGFEISDQGRVPGTAYVGGSQRQAGGAAGRESQVDSQKFDEIMGLKSNCPPWFNRFCFDVISRMLEQTFKNMQLAARRPSHIDMPFRAMQLDIWNNTPVTIPHGAYGTPGAWTTVCTQAIDNDHRGSVVAAGQAVEVAEAWANLEWRILIDGTPHYLYNAIRLQLFEFCPVSPLHHVIPLAPAQTVTWQVRNHSIDTDYLAWGRFAGWYYPVRSEDGGSIRSTIVD
jgi:hypothetical protein